MLGSHFLRIGHICFALFFSALCILPKNNLRLFAQICPDYQLMYLCIRNPIIAGNKNIMVTKILKVVKSGDMFSVKSEKSENGQLNKRNLVLKELGGKFENEYAVSVLGNAASLVTF